jgi:replicative DNA helicase
MTEHGDHTVSIRAEQAVLGSLLLDNDSLDRIGDLQSAHFYRHDHRLIFEEIQRQVVAGRRVDPMTLFEALNGKVDDCLPYLGKLRASAGSSANIGRHAEIVSDKASKRALAALSLEMHELAASHHSAAVCVDLVASKLEALAQKKTSNVPLQMSETLANYMAVLEARADGSIMPISTGHADLDVQLDGGLERGTLTVVAGRPAMGKTAFGLGIARNVAHWGSSLFLSMEMSETQVNDRNVSALGKIPLKWLRKPGNEGGADGQDHAHWAALTHVVHKSLEMKLAIDDQTGLNMMEIRTKARQVKRKHGLDVVVVDQLSFITGGKSDKDYVVVGEYTRAFVALAKELDVAVILLCQLNRECEKRPNKRPMMADLAISGSIEQDAANVMFLYRDEVYNPESPDRGICEVNSAKQRQGQPGVIALNYIGSQTRFEDLAYPWCPHRAEEKPARRGFGAK